MKLSEKLRKLRIEKGETQEDVSKKLEIGITTLRNYENDSMNRLPNTYQLKQLKEYYNVPYEYLLNDNCKNIVEDNIKIGENLNLSDNSIKNIKNIKDNSSLFNYFIENINLEYFLNNLKRWFSLNQLIDWDLFRLVYICDLTEYIKDRIENSKEEDLKEYFNDCDYSIERIKNFTSNYENSLYFPASNSAYELFYNNYNYMKNILFSKNYENKYEDFSIALEDFMDLHEEVLHTMRQLRNLVNFEINEHIDRFLKKNQITEIGLGSKHYTEILGKYINNINSDI